MEIQEYINAVIVEDDILEYTEIYDEDISGLWEKDMS